MGLDAYVPGAGGTVIAFGDSITDGAASDVDGYNDWPSLLAERFNAMGMRLGVVNDGIAGNAVRPCSGTTLGEPALERFDRDVLQHPHVRAIIIMEGGNDLRNCGVSPAHVAAGLDNLVVRAQAAGIRVLLGTYVPRVSRVNVVNANLMPDALGDDERQALNGWIRGQWSRVDALVDFDEALRDPNRPGSLDPSCGSRDGIHPGPPGNRMMADLIPVEVLAR
jgi:lysophospholipase L1-like esterase